MIPFPQQPVNDNHEEEYAVCFACKNAAMLVIVAVGVARFQCAACHADLTSGILPLCEIEVGPCQP